MLTEEEIREKVSTLTGEELVKCIIDLQREARSEGWDDGYDEGYSDGSDYN